jgi:uncharacterized membrane protein YGL010W
MRSASTWLEEYGESHRHPTNKVLHWICVPVIVVSVIGLLWALPVPRVFADVSPWLNWGTLALAAALLYYSALSARLALGMLLVVVAVAGIVYWLDTLTTPLWLVSTVLFVVAWIGQFIGHVYEGKRPSFFKDVQFLLIGPLWLLAHLYRKVSIPV